MKTEQFDDGDVGYIYEVGDFVEITKASPEGSLCIHEVGDWGIVYRVEYIGALLPDGTKKPSICSILDIQLAGYCCDKDEFFQAACNIMSWDVKPHPGPKKA